MDIKSISFTAIALILSTSANAAIIDITNTNTEYTSGQFADLQGLQWLSFDITRGLTRTDVEDGEFVGQDGVAYQYNQNAEAGDGSWRYATRAETETLLGSLWDKIYNGWSQENYSGVNWLLEEIAIVESGTGTSVEDTWEDTRSTTFSFGEHGDCSSNVSRGCWGHVKATTYFLHFSSSQFTLNINTGMEEPVPLNVPIGYLEETDGLNAGLNAYNLHQPDFTEYSHLGHLLVRDVSAVPSSGGVVGVDGLLALLALSGVAIRRRLLRLIK